MNKVLYSLLDCFIIIYLDNIVINNQTLEEHMDHLNQVFQTLREKELYIKKEKWAFAQ